MSKRKYEDMWDILSKYQFQIDGDNISEIECVICKKILVNASQGSCGCRYCKKCIDKYLENGPKKCVGTKPECNEDFLSLEEDIQTDHRANMLISTLIVECAQDGCLYRTELGKMKEHIRLCTGIIGECLFNSIGCDSSNVNAVNLNVHLQEDIVNHTRLLIEWIGNVRNELYDNKKRVEVLEGEVVHLTNELARHKVLIENQRIEIETSSRTEASIDIKGEDIMNELSQLGIRMDNLSERVTKEDDFLWKVDGMKEKVNEARMGIRAMVYSEPFYTHKHGYKMRLSMHPNGYGHREGTHLYVLFCVMKGDYDELLLWPLTRPVTLGIVDRNTGRNHCTYRFAYDTTEPSFRGSFARPHSNMNMAMGTDEFVSLVSLFNYQNLLRDGSIFIRCSLGP